MMFPSLPDNAKKEVVGSASRHSSVVKMKSPLPNPVGLSLGAPSSRLEVKLA